MQWLILIGNKQFDLRTIKSMNHQGSIACCNAENIENRFCVDYGDDHIFYDYDEETEDYENEDLIKIPYNNPHFITMIYTSESRIKKVLQQDDFPQNIYIDNDHGLILPLKNFIQIGMPLDSDESSASGRSQVVFI